MIKFIYVFVSVFVLLPTPGAASTTSNCRDEWNTENVACVLEAYMDQETAQIFENMPLDDLPSIITECSGVANIGDLKAFVAESREDSVFPDCVAQMLEGAAGLDAGPVEGDEEDFTFFGDEDADNVELNDVELDTPVFGTKSEESTRTDWWDSAVPVLVVLNIVLISYAAYLYVQTRRIEHEIKLQSVIAQVKQDNDSAAEAL